MPDLDNARDIGRPVRIPPPPVPPVKYPPDPIPQAPCANCCDNPFRSEILSDGTEVQFCTKCGKELRRGKPPKVPPIKCLHQVTVLNLREGAYFCKDCGEMVIDMIGGNKPRVKQVGESNHYNRCDVEPIDLIAAMESTKDAFVDFCRGNAIKYCARIKGDWLKIREDLLKAADYATRAAKRIEERYK